MSKATITLALLIATSSTARPSFAADKDGIAEALRSFQSRWPRARRAVARRPFLASEKHVTGFEVSPDGKRLIVVTDARAARKDFHSSPAAVAVVLDGPIGSAWAVPIERSHSIDDFQWSADGNAVFVTSTVNFYDAVTLIDLANRRVVVSGAATNGEYQTSPTMTHVAYLSALSGDESDRGTGCTPTHTCGDELHVDATAVYGTAAPDGARITGVKWVSDSAVEFCVASGAKKGALWTAATNRLTEPSHKGDCVVPPTRE